MGRLRGAAAAVIVNNLTCMQLWLAVLGRRVGAACSCMLQARAGFAQYHVCVGSNCSMSARMQVSGHVMPGSVRCGHPPAGTYRRVEYGVCKQHRLEPWHLSCVPQPPAPDAALPQPGQQAS